MQLRILTETNPFAFQERQQRRNRSVGRWKYREEECLAETCLPVSNRCKCWHLSSESSPMFTLCRTTNKSPLKTLSTSLQCTDVAKSSTFLAQRTSLSSTTESRERSSAIWWLSRVRRWTASSTMWSISMRLLDSSLSKTRFWWRSRICRLLLTRTNSGRQLFSKFVKLSTPDSWVIIPMMMVY